MKFSVLLSVYFKETSSFLDQALQSVLIQQSLKPNEVVIVKDGPLTYELDAVINKYISLFPEIVKIIALEENKGLGQALEIGLKNCSYDIVARADTDDINDEFRFEKQIEAFKMKPKVDVVGGNIAEFSHDPNEIQYIKKVPKEHEHILKMVVSRNPMNHMSVMFKKQSVIASGGYLHLMYAEDYYLWVRMLINGYTLMNIDEILVKVRAGDEMYKRRSNPEIISSLTLIQKLMYSNKMISYIKMKYNILKISMFVKISPKAKKSIYKWILRS